MSASESVGAIPRSVLDGDRAGWRTSSFSQDSACVEVAVAVDAVRVRNSRDRSLAHLRFDIEAWAAFTSGIRRGDFTRSRGSG